MAQRRLHELAPGALSGPRGVLLTIVEGEVRHQCQLFDLSGDASHLWRAWRAARAVGDLSPFCLECLTPRLDQLARRPGSERRASMREERNWRLLDYYREVARMLNGEAGCAESPADVLRRVAKLHGTTEGAIYQQVLEFERKGGL